MAKQTFKEKVQDAPHLVYHRDDDSIRMNLELGKDEYGKRITKGRSISIKRLYIDGKREADSKFIARASRERQRLQDIHDESTVVVSDPTVTLAEYIEKYIKEVVFDPGRRIQPSTRRGYREKFQLIQKWPIAQKPIAEITTDQLRATFTIRLLSKEDGGEGRAASTEQKHYDNFNKVFNYAVNDNQIPDNPLEMGNGVQRPQISEPDKKEGASPADLKKWLEKAANIPKRQETINWLHVHLGLRPSEVAGLKWNHIDWDNKPPIIKIKQRVVKGDLSYTRRNKSLLLPGTKSSSGDRTLFMIPDLVTYLSEWKEYQQNQATYEWSEETPIVATSTGGFVRHERIQQAIKRVARAMNMEDVSATDLRSFYAWNLLMSGMPESVLIKYMGHKSIAVTRKYYFDRPTDTNEIDAVKFNNYMKQQA